MWSLGCVLCEVLLGRPLFWGLSRIEVMSTIVRLLGPLPLDSIYSSGKYMNEITPHILKCLDVFGTNSVQQRHYRIAQLSSLLRTNDEHLLNFLEGLFNYLPTERLSPLDALRHPFLNCLVPFHFLLSSKRLGVVQTTQADLTLCPTKNDTTVTGIRQIHSNKELTSTQGYSFENQDFDAFFDNLSATEFSNGMIQEISGSFKDIKENVCTSNNAAAKETLTKTVSNLSSIVETSIKPVPESFPLSPAIEISVDSTDFLQRKHTSLPVVTSPAKKSMASFCSPLAVPNIRNSAVPTMSTPLGQSNLEKLVIDHKLDNFLDEILQTNDRPSLPLFMLDDESNSPVKVSPSSVTSISGVVTAKMPVSFVKKTNLENEVR